MASRLEAKGAWVQDGGSTRKPSMAPSCHLNVANWPVELHLSSELFGFDLTQHPPPEPVTLVQVSPCHPNLNAFSSSKAFSPLARSIQV